MNWQEYGLRKFKFSVMVCVPNVAIYWLCGEWEADVEALNDRAWVDKKLVARGCGFL